MPTASRRRFPLPLTLLPLLLAGLVYWHWWDGQLDAFRGAVTAVVEGQGAPQFGGFPYRLHADLGSIALRRDAGGLAIALSAARASADRQPGRPALTVIGLDQPRVNVVAPELQGARLSIAAPTGRASVDIEAGRLARLSAEFGDTAAELPILKHLRATHFELHLREAPTAGMANASPRLPDQADLLIQGDGVRLANGDPLTLSLEGRLTGAARLRSVQDWAAGGGTAEIRRAVLSDKQGAVAELTATIVPAGGALQLAGVITTVCPLSVIAALSGAPAPSAEYRARAPLRIPVGGRTPAPVGALITASTLPAFTTRRQEPPCPRLSGVIP